jgi:carbamoyltransferase
MKVLGVVGNYSAATGLTSLLNTGEFHDSAAVLVDDGSVIAAVEEERLRRIKHIGAFPVNAVRFCLSHGGVSLSSIAAIAVGYEGGVGPYRDHRLGRESFARCFAESEQADYDDVLDKIELIDHHRAHAFSAFYGSGFQSALVVSLDAWGDGASGLIAAVRHGEWNELRRLNVRGESLGIFYSHFMPWFGYGTGDEYKVMGLAAAGDASRFATAFSELYALMDQGRFSVQTLSYAEATGFLSRLGPPRGPAEDFQPYHADVAASLQQAYERIVLHLTGHFAAETGMSHLCLAGGCAQNSVANGKIAGARQFERIFVQPASNDAGTAIGAAYAALYRRGGLLPDRCLLTTSCLGPDLGDEPLLAAALRRWHGILDYERVDEPAAAAAELLEREGVIGWMQGRSEFGPRALGARSILADARRADIKDRLNKIIKGREAYRPFGPAMLPEEARRLLVLSGAEDLRYMTFTVCVQDDQRASIPAAVHIDGTARPQVVSETGNPLFWRLLMAFRRRTGIGVVVNTSFNIAGEPIVQTIEDAFHALLTAGLPVIVAGHYVIRAKPAWQTQFDHLQIERRPAGALLEDVNEPIGQRLWTVDGVHWTELSLEVAELIRALTPDRSTDGRTRHRRSGRSSP